ncbi:hypothetical protein V2G26_009382 [Clonostachys chloroleuca]
MELTTTKLGRTRTFTGCRTCRRRHTKCDEMRPTCKACQEQGLACGGYAPRLIWARDIPGQILEPVGDEETQTRFPLFSVSYQECLSKQLSQSLCSRTTDNILLDLQAALRPTAGRKAADIQMGPFGAFQTSKPQNFPDKKDTYLQSSTSTTVEEVGAKAPRTFDHTDISLYLDGLTGQLDHVDMDDLDLLLVADVDLDVQQGFATEPDSSFDLSIEPSTYVSHAGPPALSPTSSRKDTLHDEGVCRSRSSSFIIKRVVSPNSASPIRVALADAPFLLRHYKKHIDASSTAMRAKRISPWQLLFLPCAFQTFGELTSLGDTSNVRIAILSAILSRSAFHYSKTIAEADDAQHWQSVGMNHGLSAQYYLQEALKQDMAKPEETNYHDLLMAFLAIALTLLYQGGQAPRCLLRDAERLICFRGYTSHKSQHTRILHHLYTYLRVLIESAPSADQAQDNEVGIITPATPHKSTKFRITEDTLNVGLDPDYEKTADVGYGDMHLELQGRWRETLHSTIHGVPESLMTLLAQTTSLANEVAHLHRRIPHDANLSLKFRLHTKTLEEQIWSWNLDPDVQMASGQDSNQSIQNLIDCPQTQSMIRALHQALTIYFYRRVYDVSPRVLQDNVHQALTNLEACMEEIAADEHFTPCLAWTTMITASAAILTKYRKRALNCVEIIDGIGFHYTGRTLKEVVESMWTSSGI